MVEGAKYNLSLLSKLLEFGLLLLLEFFIPLLTALFSAKSGASTKMALRNLLELSLY